MNFGWQWNPEQIAAAYERIAASGVTFRASADRPSLVGNWKRLQSRGITRVTAQDDEKKATGIWRDPNSQSRGTCVGQGSSRAIEDVHNARLADKIIVGKPVQIAYEPMYAYEFKTHWGRTQPWGTQGQCSDGIMGAQAAEYYTGKGVICRANYTAAGVDLSKPREDLAINWINSGVPDVLIAACAFHKIICHWSDSWDEYADCISAKCYGHLCCEHLFGFSQVIHDKFGCVLPDSSGGHDTEVCGLFVLKDGSTGFHIQNSWGKGPKYPTHVETISGPIELRPGSYVVRQEVLQNFGERLERISCDIPSVSSFR